MTTVYGGMVAHPVSRARETLGFDLNLTQEAPDDLTVYLSLFANPDAPDEAMVARQTFEALGTFMAGRSYINNLTAEDGRKVHEVWDTNRRRLVTAKRRYDPANLFRLNHNIDPAA